MVPSDHTVADVTPSLVPSVTPPLLRWDLEWWSPHAENLDVLDIDATSGAWAYPPPLVEPHW